jgi:hypothetical protein
MGVWVSNFDAFVDFITVIVLCAPDQFPENDFPTEEAQLTLDSAFDELRQGMRFVAERISDDAVLSLLWRYMNVSFEAYKADKITEGALILQKFERILLANAKT